MLSRYVEFRDGAPGLARGGRGRRTKPPPFSGFIVCLMYGRPSLVKINAASRVAKPAAVHGQSWQDIYHGDARFAL
eukprot:84517-Amphidinium_carterae.1